MGFASPSCLSADSIMSRVFALIATIKSIKINKVFRNGRAFASLSICSSTFSKVRKFNRSRKERLRSKHSQRCDLDVVKNFTLLPHPFYSNWFSNTSGKRLICSALPLTVSHFLSIFLRLSSLISLPICCSRFRVACRRAANCNEVFGIVTAKRNGKSRRVENFFQIAGLDSHVNLISKDSRFEINRRKVPRDF